jgi:hypothetical protein
MRKIMVAALAVLAISGVSNAAIEEYYEEKPIKIQKADTFDSEKQVKIRLGKDIAFKITVYQGEFFGDTTISANANIDNTTQKKVKAIYSIAFFDKDGKLVGCHQGSWDLEPDDDVNYGSGIIYADEESIASITSYKLRIQAIESIEK